MKKLHDFDETFDSQKMFRIILEAMANPTRTLSIKLFADKLPGESPEFLSIAMTMLDNEVSFNACGNEQLAKQIILLTQSTEDKIENSDFIFVSDMDKLEDVIKKAKSGTLSDPHGSATIIIENDDNNDVELNLFGAGIDGVVSFKTSDIVRKAIKIRDSKEYEYPQGLEFIFVSKQGNMFCIPRLTLKEVL